MRKIGGQLQPLARGASASTSKAVAIAARPSPRPVSPSPSVVVADTDTGASSTCDSTVCASARRGPTSGTVADDLHCRIADPVAVPCEQIRDVAQHVHTADTGPPRVVDTEHVADIAQSGRRQQRVAQRVDGHVAVGVPGAAVDVGKQQTQQPTRPTGFDRVHIGAQTDPNVHWFTIACASNRSKRVVILKASGSPSTTCT